MVLLVASLFTIHDIFFALGFQDSVFMTTSYIGQLGIPLLLAFFMFVLAREHAQALRAANDSNQTLEARVALVSEELEKSYEAQRKVENEQAQLEERQRIYRDIRDDLGSKLLSIVQTAEDDEQRSLARSALNDMRSIVAGDLESSDITDVGKSWRTECEDRCSEAGVITKWLAPSQILLASDQATHMTRIVRELLTNALKHAKCSEITIIARFHNEQPEVVVADDGEGIKKGDLASGLQSVRSRVLEIGGTVRWDTPKSGGTMAVVSVANGWMY